MVGYRSTVDMQSEWYSLKGEADPGKYDYLTAVRVRRTYTSLGTSQLTACERPYFWILSDRIFDYLPISWIVRC